MGVGRPRASADASHLPHNFLLPFRERPPSAGGARRVRARRAAARCLIVTMRRHQYLYQPSHIQTRHARARRGHPRLKARVNSKTWMAGTSPAMTKRISHAQRRLVLDGGGGRSRRRSLRATARLPPDRAGARRGRATPSRGRVRPSPMRMGMEGGALAKLVPGSDRGSYLRGAHAAAQEWTISSTLRAIPIGNSRCGWTLSLF